MRTVLRGLTLRDFRSYGTADLDLTGRPVALFGPNGAGKTNLLEAVSLLASGRGLRNAPLAELGRRAPGDDLGADWVVAARVEADAGEVRLGTASAGPSRRIVRIDGEPAPPGRLSDHVRLVWLTPQHDRLFVEGASERRRFVDRLTFAAEPEHAAASAAYEKAIRERTRLLVEPGPDPAWIGALEAQAAASGAQVSAARARTVAALQGEIERRGPGAFPVAEVTLAGAFDTLALEGAGVEDLSLRIAEALASGRRRDAAAGRALSGPHRADLVVRHRQRGRFAAECSTGEQKALLLNLVLAHASRLSRADSAPNPILLLDEVAAHLDAERRGALFDEIEALGLQAFLTGTDAALFEGLVGRADRFYVSDGGFAAAEPT